MRVHVLVDPCVNRGEVPLDVFLEIHCRESDPFRVTEADVDVALAVCPANKREDELLLVERIFCKIEAHRILEYPEAVKVNRAIVADPRVWLQQLELCLHVRVSLKVWRPYTRAEGVSVLIHCDVGNSIISCGIPNQALIVPPVTHSELDGDCGHAFACV